MQFQINGPPFISSSTSLDLEMTHVSSAYRSVLLKGGTVHNNPSELALEAERIWNTISNILLVSVGSGRQRPVRVVDIYGRDSEGAVEGSSLKKRIKSALQGLDKFRNLNQTGRGV
jgi:hypothetical protein